MLGFLLALTVGERRVQRGNTVFSWEANAVGPLATVLVYKDPVVNSATEVLVARNSRPC